MTQDARAPMGSHLDDQAPLSVGKRLYGRFDGIVNSRQQYCEWRSDSQILERMLTVKRIEANRSGRRLPLNTTWRPAGLQLREVLHRDPGRS
jgi:hypothetical protein